jgi:hypothetical protein
MKKKIGSKNDESPAQVIDVSLNESSRRAPKKRPNGA